MDDHWNLLNVGWYRRTGDGVVLEVNDAELAILGYSREEMVGHHVSEFLATEIVPLLSEQIDGYNEGNQRLIMTMGVKKDGGTVPSSTSSIVGSSAKTARWSLSRACR